jgi:hypothetical protein
LFSALPALVLRWLLGDLQVPMWALAPFGFLIALGAIRSQLEGTYHLESGLEAEAWTSRDLKKALGRGWYVVDGISFGDMGDVDHVAVGPSGVFAVETKYTDSTQDSRAGRAIAEGWIVLSTEQVESVRAAFLDWRGIREDYERKKG